MCGGVTFIYQGKEQTVYFPRPNAQIPVHMRTGEIQLLTWGRRQSEQGHLPLGGWARLESIKAQRWNKFFPKPVKIAVDSFMEKDLEGKSHWFILVEGQYIQGLLASYQEERRVYVVTIEPEVGNSIHDRWPRIIFSG